MYEKTTIKNMYSTILMCEKEGVNNDTVQSFKRTLRRRINPRTQEYEKHYSGDDGYSYWQLCKNLSSKDADRVMNELYIAPVHDYGCTGKYVTSVLEKLHVHDDVYMVYHVANLDV